MIQTIETKKGDTLRFHVTFKDENGDPIIGLEDDLKSEIRDKNNKLIGSFTVEPDVDRYVFTNDGNLPVETLFCDIKLNTDGIISSSTTFKIKVIQDVTKW